MLTFTKYLQNTSENFEQVKSSYAQMLYEARLLAFAKKPYDKVREKAVLDRLSVMVRLEYFLKGNDVLLTKEKKEFVSNYVFDCIKFDYDNETRDIKDNLKKIPADAILESIPYPFEEFYNDFKEIAQSKELILIAKRLSGVKNFSSNAIKKAIS